jgi:hypothetical protein
MKPLPGFISPNDLTEIIAHAWPKPNDGKRGWKYPVGTTLLVICQTLWSKLGCPFLIKSFKILFSTKWCSLEIGTKEESE